MTVNLINSRLCLGSSQQCGTGENGLFDSNYFFESGGDAVAYRFQSPVSSTLDTFYFYSEVVVNSPGDFTIEVRTADGSLHPGTILDTEDVLTATGWIQVDFSPAPTVEKYQTYFVIIGMPDATATDFARIQAGSAYCLNNSTGGMEDLFRLMSTTDGFATDATLSSFSPCGVLKFGDGTIYGNPYVNISSIVPNSLERGYKILGFNSDMVLSGVYVEPDADVSGYKIYDSSSAPGDTPLVEHTGSDTEIAQGAYFGEPYRLSASTVYRVVITYSSASATPGFADITADGGNVDLLAAGHAGSNLIMTTDDGGGGWTDESDRAPMMVLVFSAFD